MTSPELLDRVRDAQATDLDAFEARVAEEAETLKSELREGTFDQAQARVGLEQELYGCDRDGNDLVRVPRRLLELVGFESELGLHNAEMHTSPQPLNGHGLAAQEAEVRARIEAAQTRASVEDIRLVSDGLWTVSPTGESAADYLDDNVDRDGVVMAVNMSDSVRYQAMNNCDSRDGMAIETPHVSFETTTVLPTSLTTSIQPHYQVARAAAFPAYHGYALRVAGPLLALGVNSPFFPPELYDGDATAADVLADHWMENRIPVFESVDRLDGCAKVRFPGDVATLAEAVEHISCDDCLVPMWVDPQERFDDAFRHLTLKRGSYWRWIRPVFEGGCRAAANARVEFRPLPAQPTVRDAVAFLALFAGLMEGLYLEDHPVAALEWETAKENFYAAMRHGLDADVTWITADGERTTDTRRTYTELFRAARDGLTARGVAPEVADEYLRPLRGRLAHETTPASWKHDRVAEAVADGASLSTAIERMQRSYVDRQGKTLLSGSFLDWVGAEAD
ncbi:MAG: hypothetical protein ABEJ79_10005 [Halolamina sp.]